MDTAKSSARPRKKPSRIGTFIAWAVVILAILVALISVSQGSFAERVGGLFLAVAFAIAPARILYCRARDRKAWQQHDSAVANEAQLRTVLGDSAYLGVTQGAGLGGPPERKPRRWGVVVGSTVAAYVLSALILPTPEPAEVQSVAAESSAPTVTAEKRDEEDHKGKEREAEASAAREAEKQKAEEKALEERRKNEAREQEERAERDRIEREEAARKEAEDREREAQAERDRIAQEEAAAREREAQAERDRIAREEAARVEQERVRAQQQQALQFAPVAPAAAPAASYKNCTAVWNAINRPITREEAGYASHLDRDGDGTGCEKDPR